MRPPPDRFNPGGYYQRPDVISFNRWLLEGAGGSEEAPPDPGSIRIDRVPGDHGGVALPVGAGGRPIGIKDPRFSVTLLAWLESGRLSGRDVWLVRVRRSIDRIAASTVRHREVGAFCGFDVARAARMAERYDRFAGWHAQRLGLPVHEVVYEQLIHDPHSTVKALAAFTGQTGEDAARGALRRIGKRRALIRHYVHKASHPYLMMQTLRKTLAAYGR